MALIAAAVIGVLGAAAGGIGASQSAGAARDAAAQIAQMAGNLGRTTRGRVSEVDFEAVDPLSQMDRAAELTQFGRDIMRTAAYGEENLEGADTLRSSLLRQANFDFSDLPEGAIEALDTSALARSFGGPGGLAENISLNNRIQLANRGLTGFQNMAQMEASFTPNPVANVWDLAKFETSNRLTQLQLDQWRVQQLNSIDQFVFNAQTGAVQQRAANDAGAVNWAAAGSVLQSVGSAVSGYSTGATMQGNSAQLQGSLQSSLSALGGGSGRV